MLVNCKRLLLWVLWQVAGRQSAYLFIENNNTQNRKGECNCGNIIEACRSCQLWKNEELTQRQHKMHQGAVVFAASTKES